MMNKTSVLLMAVGVLCTVEGSRAQTLTASQALREGGGLPGFASLAASPDGSHLYASGSGTVAVFRREADSGVLEFVEIHRNGIGGVEGLAGAGSVALSPDGNQVYVASQLDDAVVVFSRNHETGGLDFLQVRRNIEPDVSGLAFATALAVSPDGADVYVAAEEAITVFSRDAQTGALTFLETRPDGVEGFAVARSVAISPQGDHVYLVSDTSLATFSRDASGSLTFVEAIRGGIDIDADLLGAASVAISPDGAHLYLASFIDSSLTVFARDPTDGRLTHSATYVNGQDGLEGFDRAEFVTVSPDGVYVIVTGTNSAVVFRRDAKTGLLSFRQAFVDNQDGVDGLSSARSPTFSPNGSHLYVASGGRDDTVADFRFDPQADSFVFVTDEFEGIDRIDGLSGVRSVRVSPAGTEVYAASGEALAVFRRDLESGQLAFAQALFDGEAGGDDLDGSRSVEVSPDGNHVYVASHVEDFSLPGPPVPPDFGAVSVFRRDASTGMLTFVEVHRDGDEGVDGLKGALDVAVSPDGAHVYVASGPVLRDRVAGSVAVFRRNAQSGSLTFLEAHQQGQDGVDGLDRACDITVSPDGLNVYVASFDSQALAVFNRDRESGALTFSKAHQVFDFASAVAVSPDGAHVYVGLFQQAAVTIFERDPATGALTLLDQTASIEGLLGTESTTLNPEGTLLFAVSRVDNAVAVFQRDAASGLLTLQEVHFDQREDPIVRLAGAYSADVSPDGTDLYVASGGASTLQAFKILTPLEFPQFGNGGGFRSEIVLTNPGPQAVAGEVHLIEASGAPLDLTPHFETSGLVEFSPGVVQFVIPPWGSLRLATDGQGTQVLGSARVTSESRIGGVIRFEAEEKGIAGVGAAPAARSVIVPVRQAGGFDTGIAVRNCHQQPIEIQLTLRDLEGQIVAGGESTLLLPASARVSQFIGELFPDAQTEGLQGSVALVSNSTFAALALEQGETGQLTTLPVTPFSISAAKEGVGDPDGFAKSKSFAQFGNGGGLASEIVVSAGGLATRFETEFFDAQGTSLDMRSHLSSSAAIEDSSPVIRFELAPLAGMRIKTDGAGELQQGSATIRFDQAAGGLIRFEIIGNGVAGVAAARPVPRAMVPVVRIRGGINTGLAIRNENSEAVQLTLSLRDLSGDPAPQGVAALDLAAGARLARFIDELFPEADTDRFSGTVIFESSLPVSAVALEQGPQPGQLTTLPVTEISHPIPET